MSVITEDELHADCTITFKYSSHCIHYMYKNVIETVMMILNLGLQAVGLAQRRMEDNVRRILSKESYMIGAECAIIL